MRWPRPVFIFFALLAILLFAPASHALPPGFQEQIVLSGLNGPVHLKSLPDGRMLLLQKTGEMFIFDPSTDPVQKTSYMTITDIETGGERGLLTVALDPDFVTNGYLYIYYTNGTSSRNRISRFTHQGSTASLASEVLIWQDNENWSDQFHYGGGLDFGPDGRIYLTTGEEYEPAQAQDLTRAGGKIIRVNKDGSIPADNPFIDGPGGNLDEIWAYGLRNPWRAYWDLVNNRFYIGEVGGNVEATAREDLHIGRAGANYGWPYCEGQCTDPQYDDPIYDYGHVGVTPAGGSITAGFVYRGSQYPAEYTEAFFFADYARSFIKYLKFNADGSVASVNDFATNVGYPVAMEMGADGAVYIVDYAGQVRRYVYVGIVADDPFAGLVLQLESDAGVSLAGNMVTGWTDQSAAGNDLMAVGDPQLLPGVLNGLPVIEFDGNGDKLERTSGLVGLPIGTADRTVTVLANYASTGFGGFAYGTGSCNQAFGLIVDAAGNLSVQGWCSNSDFATQTSGTGAGWLVQSAIVSSGQMNHYADGVLIDSQVHNYDTVLDRIVLGAEIADFYYLNMQVAAVFVHNRALNSNEQQMLMSYLQQKYFGVTPGNQAPVANDDTDKVFRGTSVTIDVLSNDTDADGSIDPATVTITQQPSAGSLTVDPVTGVIEYTHDGSAVTIDSFSYQVSDDLALASNDAVVTVSILNESNVTFADVQTIFADRCFVCHGGSRDPDLSAANAYTSIVNVPSSEAPALDYVEPGSSVNSYLWHKISGTQASVGGSGVQMPASGAPLPASDINLIAAWIDAGAQSGNIAPVAVDDNATVATAGAVDIAVLLNDTDGDNWSIDMATVMINMPPANGTVTDDGNGVLTYTHDGSATTNDSFTYTVTDTLGAVSNSATVTLSIGVQPLVTTGLVLQLESDAGVSETAGVVTSWLDQSGQGNDVVASGDPQLLNGILNGRSVIDFDGVADKLERTAALNSLPSGNADRTVFVVANYRSNAGFGGFAYGTANCNETFGLVVDSAGKLAVQGWCAVNDFSTTDLADGAGWLMQSAVLNGGVLTHYRDGVLIDTRSHTYNTVLTNMVLGAELNSNTFVDMQLAAVLVYDRALGVAERQQVEAYLNDRYLPTNSGNRLPVAVDDAATVSTAGSVDIPVLSNDSDADGTLDPTTVTIMLPPANGAVLDNGAGLLTYTHDGSVTSSDSFTYTVADTAGGISNTATVTIAVTGAGNQPPLTVDDSTTVVAGGSVDVAVLNNDVDSDGSIDPTSVTIVTQPANGTVLDDGAGLLTYTHDGTATTNDSFSYTVADTLGAISVTATVNLSIVSQPLVSAGLVLDLDADLGVLSDAGVVSAWQDQSGMGNDLTASGDPIILTGALNGHSVVDFDGVTDKLERAVDLYSLPQDNSDRTVFVVANYRGTGFGGFAFGTASCNQAFGLVVDDTGKLTVQGWCPGNDFAAADAGTGVGWLTQSTILDAGVVTQYKDGAQISSSPHVYATAVSNMVLGAELNSNRFTDMQVATVLVYNRALNVVEHQQVQTYLRDKYFPENSFNQYPVATDDSATVATTGSVDIAVLSNDTDDGALDPATVSIMLPPAHGTILGNGTGLLTYTHDGSATTSDSFTYTVADTQGGVSSIATVTITVTGAGNQPPVAVDDGATVVMNGSVDIPVLTNDIDADGSIDTATVSVMLPPAHGALIDNGAGVLTYTHDGTASANDSFTYTVSDTLGAVSSTATVTLNIIAPGNQRPVATADSASVVSTGSVDIAILSNDSDADGSLDPSTVTVVTPPVNGSLTDNGAGVLTYTDNGTAAGDSFTYTVADTLGAVSNTAMVTVTVTASGNQSPLATTDSATVSTAGSVVIAVQSNDSDADGSLDPATVTIVDAPVSGIVTDDGAGVLTYKHDGTASTSDNFSYTVSDDSGQVSNKVNVSITVVANTADGDVAPVTAPDGKLNAADILVMTQMVLGQRTPTLAQLQHGDMYPPGSPDGSINLSDLILLQKQVLLSGAANSVSATVTDSATVVSSSSVNIDILSNDIGTYDPVSVSIVDAPTHGSLVDTGGGILTYTHDGSATNSDSFTYTVTDTSGAVSDATTVGIVVAAPGNQAPVANDDSAVLSLSSLVDIAVLSNDIDVDGMLDETSVSVISQPSHGSIVVDGAGVLRYQHDGSASSSDSFTYTVRDIQGRESNPATVMLTVVAAVNQPPVAADDSAMVSISGSVDIAVLSNDFDAEGALDPTLVSIISAPANGTLIDDAAGTVTYIHDGTATTSDSFSYSVTDTQGGVSNIATVSIDVSGAVNLSPIATDDSATVVVASSVNIVALSNDSDADGSIDPTTLSIVQQPSAGTLSVDPVSGDILYTHDGSATSSDQFSYEVQDSGGAVSNVASVMISIVPEGYTPAIQAAIYNSTVVEGAGDLEFIVSLSRPASTVVSIDYSTVDDTAVANTNYLSATGNIQFLPGESRKSISITVLPDLSAPTGMSKRMRLELSKPFNASLTNSLATGTIIENDRAAINNEAEFSANWVRAGSAFTNAAVCGSGCHSSDGISMDVSGEDVSPVTQWKHSVMANAFNDPYWQAAVQDEVDTFPHLAGFIENTCTTCHAPMGRTHAHHTGTGLDVDGYFRFDTASSEEISREGVSCTACHQIDAGNLGTAGSFSGGFTIVGDSLDPDYKRIYGPYDNPVGTNMVTDTGHEPTAGSHISSSALCATCHTLYTPTLDPETGIPTGTSFLEQGVYFEWQNSEYATGGAQQAECQTCHMPEPSVGYTTPISLLPNTAPDRTPYSQHTLVGGNTHLLGMLREYRPEMGIANTTSTAGFDDQIAKTRGLLSKAAVVQVSALSELTGSLEFDVAVSNNTGHKLPSSYPSRRVWLQVTVRNSSGQIIFESGKPDARGYISTDAARLKADCMSANKFAGFESAVCYEPHRDVITDQSQVAIYETVLGDVNDNITHTLLQASQYLKDNRIPPVGFTNSTAVTIEAQTVPTGVAGDADFNCYASSEGCGQDTVHYQVNTEGQSGPYSVEAKLLYQATQPGFVDGLHTGGDRVNRFKQMYDAVPPSVEVLSTATSP